MATLSQTHCKHNHLPNLAKIAIAKDVAEAKQKALDQKTASPRQSDYLRLLSDIID